MTKRFFGAVQFLTIIPVPEPAASPGESAAFFPVVGALLAVLPAASFLAFRSSLGSSVSALLSLFLLIYLTGGLHEDGLADVADAVRAERTREKMLAILADSRVGTYGALALIMSVLLRWQAIALLADRTPRAILFGFANSASLSRASLVILAGCSTPLGSGLGSVFSASCSRSKMLGAAALGLAICASAGFFIGWLTAAAMVFVAIAVSAVARSFFLRRLGGLNGDCLGAACQAVEISTFLVLACVPSI